MTETVVTIDPNRNQPVGQPKSGSPPSNPSTTYVRFNIGYFITIPGIIKLIQLVIGIICMACAAPAYIGATHFFLFVAVVAFIASLLWTFVYLFSVRELLTLPINWILTELLNTGIEAVMYLIAFIVQLSTWSPYSLNYFYAKNIAAGVFGLFNTVAYAAGTYFLFVEHKRGSIQ